MFAFLKHRAPTGRSPRAPAAPAEAPDEHALWTDSASELENGADVVEFDGDFAATVLLEHFAQAASAAPAR